MENLKIPCRWMKSGSIGEGLAVIFGLIAGPLAVAYVLGTYSLVARATACVAVGGAA